MVAMDKSFLIAAFYRFHPVPNAEEWREQLFNALEEYDCKGVLIVADEGLNGTMAGPEEGVKAVLEFIRSHEGFGDVQPRFSWHHKQPFKRLKVRHKPEIVTFGIDGIDPRTDAGTYVEPEDWNDLISDPDVLVIDTRNSFECDYGTFKGSVDPKTDRFREFADYVQQELDPDKHKKVAMFCTGGIRCEKATAYMRQKGFEDVYHLKGGILNYLENIEPEKSMWEGDCFVFDWRVGVGHGLESTGIELRDRPPLKPYVPWAEKDQAEEVTGTASPEASPDSTESTTQSPLDPPG